MPKKVLVRNTTVTVDTSRFVQNKRFTDVEFLLKNHNGDEVKVSAHKLVLCARSPVFERMFCGTLPTGNEVTIVDVSAESFRVFLQFFYCSSFSLFTENIGDIVMLVDKYDVKDFRPLCEKVLQETITVDRAYWYYELVLTFNLSDEIRKRLEEVICEKPADVFASAAPGGSTRSVLKHILRTIPFECCEYELFLAVITWAKRSLQQQDKEVCLDTVKAEIGDCIYDIRFPLMTAGQLTNCMERFGPFLEHRMLIDILQYITNDRTLTTASIFKTTKRGTDDEDDDSSSVDVINGISFADCEVESDCNSFDAFNKEKTKFLWIKLIGNDKKVDLSRLWSSIVVAMNFKTRKCCHDVWVTVFSTTNAIFKKRDDSEYHYCYIYNFKENVPVEENAAEYAVEIIDETSNVCEFYYSNCF